MPGAEWVFRTVMWLPFGWRVCRIKRQYDHLGYRTWVLYRRRCIAASTYRDEYVPANIFKESR